MSIETTFINKIIEEAIKDGFDGHGMPDLDLFLREQKTREYSSETMGDNEIIKKTSTDDVSKKNEDVKNIPTKEPEKKSLLEQTPIKDQRPLLTGTVVERTTDKGKYRKGYIQSEGAIAKRVLNENNKPIREHGYIEYIALIDFNYGYNNKNGGWIPFVVKTGDTFFSPMSGEDNVKREKMLKELKSK